MKDLEGDIVFGYRWQTAALVSAIGKLTVQRSWVWAPHGRLWTTVSWPKAHCEERSW